MYPNETDPGRSRPNRVCPARAVVLFYNTLVQTRFNINTRNPEHQVQPDPRRRAEKRFDREGFRGRDSQGFASFSGCEPFPD